MRSLRALATLILLLCPSAAPAADQPRPNVLFIAIDDLRDWVGYLGKNPQVKTPNLDRLAGRGLSFTHSYCAAPVCNASRAALLSGLRPSQTGVYENSVDWRTVIPAAATTLPLWFKQNGYHVAGAGKIYHMSYHRPSDWTDYLSGDWVDPDKDHRTKATKDRPTTSAGDGGVGGIRFQPLAGDDRQMEDYRSVSYCIAELGKPHDRPLFLACGLRKPHMPWSVPQKYFDMYPLDKIVLPTVQTHDLDDVPPAGQRMARPEGDHAAIVKSGRWKEAVQAYLATISFADAMVGRLIDAFDKSVYKKNTLVVLWSDHGWQLGEKEHWRKFALWEEATRSPLIWIVPGLTRPGSICTRSVDFMHIYPTLCDLCGLSTPKHVVGANIRPLLTDPQARWETPALITYRFKNHAVRSEDWRYIRYENGDEELYHNAADPYEWKNLANDPQYAGQKAALAQSFPKVDAPWPAGTDAARVEKKSRKRERREER